MTYADNEIKRVYWPIKGVARMTNESESTLRFWEDEGIIGDIPRKTNGDRTYKLKEIEYIEKAQYLIRRMGFGIPGVQQAIKVGYVEDIIKFHKKRVTS